MLTALRAAAAVLRAVAAGRSSRWPALERRFLRVNPTCAACGGTVRVVGHHVVPFHVDRALELDEGNLIPMCMGPKRCHLEVGHRGSWRLYEPDVRRLAAELLARSTPPA